MSQTMFSESRPSMRSAARDLLAGIPVVDADTHLSEWYDLWTSRSPASFRDRVPQVHEVDGRPQWFIDGKNLNLKGAASAIRADGVKMAGLEPVLNMQLKDVHPACHDVRERVQLMNEQGIAAQILYPNLLGFGGQKAMLTDEELRNVSVGIYNDAMAELQADSGNRIYPMALMPWWDIALSAREAERCAAMGLRGINMNPDPHEHGVPALSDPAWDAFWEVCVDKDLPVNFHIGASDDSLSWHGAGLWPGHGDAAQLGYGSLMLFVSNMRVIANIILSRMLERHPRLKIVSVESGAGWIPFFLEGLEYQMQEARIDYQLPPREIFRRQIHACTWFERRNLAETLREVGVDNVMFETDFPHPTCLYPDSLEHMVEGIRALDPVERGKMFSGNACRVYNLDLGNAPPLTA